MRRLGWYTISAAVAVVILGGVLLLAANLYVQSQTVQQRIRQALAATLRMPVTIRKTTVSPWEGLRIDGLAAQPAAAAPPIPGALETDEPAFLTAESFRVRFALWPLLHRRLVVTLLWLDRPLLTWAQDADGRWQFPPGADARRHKKSGSPVPPATPPLDTALPASPTPATLLASPTPTRSPPATAVERPPRRPENFTVALDRFRLRHGSTDFLNAKHRSIGRFEEINLDGQLSDAQCATGTAWFDKARLSRLGLVLTRFHSNFAFDQAGALSLTDGTAAFAGGMITANYHLRTREPGLPFSAECQFNRVDLAQLLAETGNHFSSVQGNLQGTVSVQGLSDRADGRTGTGKFELVGAKLKNLPLFEMLGEATHIADLSHPEFKKAEIDCRLNGAALEIDPFSVASNDLKITAQGRYLTDEDRLDLHARLTIDEAVSRELPDVIGDQFKPCGDEAPGSRYIDFNVTGPLNNPKSNLYNRVLADPMKGFLHDLLAPKQKTPKDKSSKRRAESPTTDAPADQPTATP